MRWAVLVVLFACQSEKPAPAATAAPAAKESLDEKMRHCPLAVTGTSSALENIHDGVQFTITATGAALAEVQKRAHHIVEFAAKRTRIGHGGSDAKGGGRMRNCPIVTDHTTIVATDTPDGVTLAVHTANGEPAELRRETRARLERFEFPGTVIRDALR
jgi:hypothetical protein